MPRVNTSRSSAGRWVFFASVLLAAVTSAMLVTLALVVPPETVAPWFEETGPFERASPWLWIALALWIALVFRKPTISVAAGMVVALAAAAREWDWHVAFTEYSVLKPPFYYRGEHALHHQIIAGAIVLAVLVAATILLARLLRLKPWSRPIAWWVLTLLFAFGMLVFTKAIDRAPAILAENLGVDLGPRMRQVFYAIEEGMEMVLPVFFAAQALAHARWHRARRRLAATLAAGANQP